MRVKQDQSRQLMSPNSNLINEGDTNPRLKPNPPLTARQSWPERTHRLPPAPPLQRPQIWKQKGIKLWHPHSVDHHDTPKIFRVENLEQKGGTLFTGITVVFLSAGE